MLDDKIPPMLAYRADPFDSPRHLFEIKWDGTRCLLFKKDQEIRLQNRRLEDITWRYPELAGLPKSLRARSAILDGELVVLAEGRPDFRRLQQREQLADPLKIGLAARRLPATYIAFDVLYFNDQPYLTAPLSARKEILPILLRPSSHLVESRFILEKGQAFFKEAVAQGLEGIMGKSLASPYLPGKRSRFWLKIKPKLTRSCYIIGYTPGEGARQGRFGALLVATREGEAWVYRGKVGSGFSDADLTVLSQRLAARRTAGPPFLPPPRVRQGRWVRPELKCEVRFQEETPRGHFRAPVFLRLVA